MFTGIVQGIGTVEKIAPGRGCRRLEVSAPFRLGGLRDGDSVCLAGACLTVVASEADRFSAEIVAETLARSTLGLLRPGGRVNLELALRVGDPLGGHLVQGHVDATAAVRSVVRRHGDWRLRIAMPAAIRRFVAEKGSIAIDGVSLTVARASAREIEVALIPTTLSRSTLGTLRPGDRVNVEVDILARYLEGLMEARAAGSIGTRSRGRAVGVRRSEGER